MSKKIALSLLMVLGVMLSATAQHDAYEYASYVHKGDSLSYRIMWPENFEEDSTYPVVLFLHGAGERGSDNKKQLVHGSKLFVENSDQFPAIVIFPQCPTDSYWSSVNIEYNPDGKRTFDFQQKNPPKKPLLLVAQMMDSVVNLPFVDVNRFYVGGLSMGGMGTLELLTLRPKMFAAAFAICGGGNTGLAERYAKELALWIFHGESDSVVPFQHSQAIVNAIKQHGGEVKFNLYPGVNHNSWENAFAEPDLLPWLFSQTSKP